MAKENLSYVINRAHHKFLSHAPIQHSMQHIMKRHNQCDVSLDALPQIKNAYYMLWEDRRNNTNYSFYVSKFGFVLNGTLCGA